MGGFGGKHIDNKDCPAAVTSMICYRRPIPHRSSWLLHGGRSRFSYRYVQHLLIGKTSTHFCNVELRGLIVICFCGLHFHGGFPPTTYPGKKPKPWSYRFVVVCYPPRAIMDSQAILSFSALPGAKFLYSPPEFIDPQ